MARKRRWQAREGGREQQNVFLDRRPQDLPSARGMVRRGHGNVFAPNTTINDATRVPVTGVAMMDEFDRHMERKQGRPAAVFPDQRAGHTDPDFPMEALVRAVQRREPRAPGKSSILTAAIKQLTTLSLWTLREAKSRTGPPGYIEPVLSFLLHVPIHKRPLAWTEGDMCPIAMKEEIAKLVEIMIIAHTEQHISDRQWAYQNGRSAGDVARMLTMLLNHTRELGSSVVLYKRDRNNTYNTVDLERVAHLVQEAGVEPPKARWYQRYVQCAKIDSMTAAGTTRAWRFRVGVFQGSPLGPGVYLYQEVQYMEAMGPGHTGILSVWNDGVELAFGTERYSDEAVVPAATKVALVAMLSQQDALARKFRVRHVPSKEEYLYITWSGQAEAMKAIRHAE